MTLYPFARSRGGAAAVEMAVLAPLLMFLFLIAVDFARVFQHCVILADCARGGALYGSQNAEKAADSAGIAAAALADAGDLNPAPTITSVTGTDAAGDPYVEVTAATVFRTFATFPGIPETVNVSRTARMRVAPVVPKDS